jgi:hypothetical protein
VKPFRLLLVALAVVMVGGTIASAATGGLGQPTPNPSVGVSDSPPEPPETEAPEPTETEAPEAEEEKTSDKSGKAPDFSACDGLTGLENAICRHDALLKVKPDNRGLTNSLAHLQANLAKHADKKAAKAERKAAKAAGTHGKSGSHGHSGS